VGVAVAELDVNFNGTIADVRVLQAPDPEIASSLATVLRTWRFRVVQQGVDRKLRSRLVFYYRLENSHPVVLDAAYLLRGTLRHVANGQDPIRTLPK
jgi:hypothetical protein